MQFRLLQKLAVSIVCKANVTAAKDERQQTLHNSDER